jgi:hypothetical protein
MTLQENNQYLFGINPFYVYVSILSVLLAGPLITFIMISAIGFFNSYNRISIGAFLTAVTYYMFGYMGLIMFKIACIYTIFNIYYNTVTNNKIIELKRSNNFSHINSNGLEMFGPNIANRYDNFRNYIIDTAYKTKNYINVNNYKINKIIDLLVDIYPKLLNKVNMIYLELSNNIYYVHNILYESDYDIYVHISDYVYDGYIMLKFISMIFSTNNKSTVLLDKFATQPTPEDTEKIVNQLNTALSAMMSSFESVEYDSTRTFNKMSDDMFMKLLKF